jgi:hypothetical protein
VAEIPATVKDKASWQDLRELDEHGDGLTQWEIDWVESITVRLLSGARLSSAQAEKLEQIREARL